MSINATLILQVLAFGVLIYFVKAFLWGPISKVLEDRQKEIEEGLVAAQKSKLDKAKASEDAMKLIEQSKAQASQIIERANAQSTTIINDAKNQAQMQAEKIKESMQAEFKQSVENTKRQLKVQLSSLVMQGVTKIVQKEVDDKNHKKIIDELSKSL